MYDFFFQKENPYLQVKEKGKDVGKAYKEIRSKLRDFSDDKGRPRPTTGFFPSATTTYKKDLNSKQRKSAGPEIRYSEQNNFEFYYLL